jgi:hypothetical protein
MIVLFGGETRKCVAGPVEDALALLPIPTSWRVLTATHLFSLVQLLCQHLGSQGSSLLLRRRSGRISLGIRQALLHAMTNWAHYGAIRLHSAALFA